MDLKNIDFVSENPRHHLVPNIISNEFEELKKKGQILKLFSISGMVGSQQNTQSQDRELPVYERGYIMQELVKEMMNR